MVGELSDDGQWMWDGEGWIPSPPSPILPPPQFEPPVPVPVPVPTGSPPLSSSPSINPLNLPIPAGLPPTIPTGSPPISTPEPILKQNPSIQENKSKLRLKKMLVNGIDSHEAYGGDPWKIYAIIIMTGLIVSISLNGLWVLLCGLIGLGNTIVYIGVYIISSVCVLVGFGLKLSGDELHDPIEYTLDDNQEKLVLDRLFADISPMGSTVWGLFLGFFIGSLFSLIYFQNGPIGLTGSQGILESIFATVNISILGITFGLIDLSTVTGINYQYSILSHWVFVLFRLLIQMAFIFMILGVKKQSNFRKLEFNIDDVTTENVEDWVKLFLSKDIEKIYQKYTEEYVFLTICDEYLCGDEQSVQALMLKFPQIIPKIPEEVRECFVDSSTGKELIPDSLMGQGGLQYMTPRGQRAVKQELVDKWTDDAITSHIEEHLAQRMEAK